MELNQDPSVYQPNTLPLGQARSPLGGSFSSAGSLVAPAFHRNATEVFLAQHQRLALAVGAHPGVGEESFQHGAHQF